ncbi:cGMP-dependent protein kinase 1 isoform X2 [Arapaima gigas]
MSSELEEDFARILLLKEERIKDLERRLAEKEDEIQELRRKLHKCQSVLPRPPIGGPRTRRAQGISAEPQTHRDVAGQAFCKHPKSDRYGTRPFLSAGMETSSFIQSVPDPDVVSSSESRSRGGV